MRVCVCGRTAFGNNWDRSGQRKEDKRNGIYLYAVSTKDKVGYYLLLSLPQVVVSLLMGFAVARLGARLPSG